MRSILILFYSLLISFSKCTFQRTSQTIIHSPSDSFLDISQFYFNFGAANIPHPDKQEKGGEDSLVASKYLLGVADGVGSWVNFGIDPRDFSYRLMHNADTYFKAYPKAYANNPKKLVFLSALTNAYKGSSTMVICTLHNNDLYTANVGDSGYMILIPVLKKLPKNAGTSFIYDIVFQSKPQQHSYNFPFQLGPTGDDPLKVTETKVHRMGYGALVLVYSDGVSDNLFPQEIRAIVNMYIQELKLKSGIQIRDFVPVFDSNELSERIKKKAYERSLDLNAISPFQVGAMDWAVIFKGGKSDDISIVTGMVLEKPEKTSKPEVNPQQQQRNNDQNENTESN
jgi:protein phosphatase PTC7